MAEQQAAGGGRSGANAATSPPPVQTRKRNADAALTARETVRYKTYSKGDDPLIAAKVRGPGRAAWRLGAAWRRGAVRRQHVARECSEALPLAVRHVFCDSHTLPRIAPLPLQWTPSQLVASLSQPVRHGGGWRARPHILDLLSLGDHSHQARGGGWAGCT
jgi:hypothetical protein